MVEVNLNKTINFISTTAIPDDPQRFPWVPVGVTITAYIVFFVYLLLAKFGVIESVNSNVHPGPQRKDAFVLQNKQVADAGQTPSNSGGQSFSQNT